MIRKRQFMNLLLTLTLVAAAFLIPAPSGYAQADEGWSEPVNLSMSGAAINPVMVVDLYGTIHAIWIDDVDGYKYSQSPEGVTWTPPVTVKFPFGAKDPPPVLMADANGSIHLFWISSDQGLYYGQATPSDFGIPNNWKTSSRLARDVMSFDVTMDARGALHIAYVRKSTTDANPAGVYYRQSIIGGGFWSESSRLYETEYFRAAKQNDVYVRVSTSNTRNDQKVYVTWDNRAQKRIFMAVSQDSGTTWGEAQQVKGPEDTGGIDTPFNLTVSAFADNVLLIWQAGEPGASNCTIYSQSSEDGGVNWGDSIAVLGGRSECPLSTKIIGNDGKSVSVMFIGQVNPLMVAWNGTVWSGTQSQTQLPSLLNPLTYDAVLLGCRFDLLFKDRYYVLGCDQGRGGDVWFLSRTLEPVEKWFSPSVILGEPTVLQVKSEKPERVSHFHSVPDESGNIHAVWVQSPVSQVNASDAVIKYARWDGQRWTTPESVVPKLTGLPIQLLATSDALKRLLLTWIDGYNGDLVFSWANLEKANLTSEWVDVTGLPTPSRLVNSSDVVVDGSGRIINAYVVPINEARGIYIVQSTDIGKNWSAPVTAFDAVAAGWERIEQPRISLGSGGVLHLIFVRSAVREGQPVGLYYSRSVDGGLTWSDAQIMSEGAIQWADIVSYGEGVVHVVWQEYDGLVFANISQISMDGGLTWGKQNNVTGVNESATDVALAADGRGLLHFIQLASRTNSNAVNQISLVLQDWKWDGRAWALELTKDITLKGRDIKYSMSADMTSTGLMEVFMPVEYTTSVGTFASEILTFSRFIEGADHGQPLQVPVIPTPPSEADVPDVVEVQVTATPNFDILYDDNVSTSPLQENAVGLGLIGVGVLATIFLLLRRRPAKRA